MSEYEDWEPDEDFEPPDLDEPERRLHFEELDPLIQGAAESAWERQDYPEAVRDAWNAVRDLLRQRLGAPELDGVDLVNRIGETDPRLPLTDLVTETDINMHRGLVNILRGAVWYVRNPEMHETESPVEGDRVGAFERLAMLSLCARHIAAAGSPAAVDDVVGEASQAGLPRTTETANELVSTVARRLQPELARRLARAAQEKHAEGQVESLMSLAFVFRALSRKGDEATKAAAAEACGRLIADDTTIEVAGRLLVVGTYSLLAGRHQTKLARFLADALSGGRVDRRVVMGGGGSLQATQRLIRGMTPADRATIVDAAKQLLAGSWASQAFGTRLAMSVERALDDDERKELADGIASAIAADNAFGATEEVETGWPTVHSDLKAEIVQGLRDLLPSARDPDAVESLLERLVTEDAETF